MQVPVAQRPRREAERCNAADGRHGLRSVDRRRLPTEATIASLTELFSLLANDTRLKLLLALYDHSPANGKRTELCVCELATTAGASESMTSHQLRLLRDAGLVTFRRDGKFARYALRDGPQAHLLGDALEYSARR